MKQEIATEIKVGALVGVAIILAAVTILSLGSGPALFTSRHETLVQFKTVEGLGPGSVVQLSGLPIGNITKITLARDTNYFNIHMSIDKEYADRLTEGTTASGKTQGALGDKFVYISPGPPDAPLIPSGGYLLAAQGGDLFSTLAERGSEVEKVFDVLDNLDRFIKGLAEEKRSALIMQNLVAATSDLKSVLRRLNEATGPDEENNRLALAIDRLASVINKIDNGQGTLGALINDPSIHNNLKAILGGSKRNQYLKGVIRSSIKESETN